MKKLFFFGLVCFTCSSCGAYLNKLTKINVVTEGSGKVVINEDTLKTVNRVTKVTIPQTKNPLEITVFNDSVARTISVDPRGKKFPATIYIPMDSGKKYLTYVPYVNPYKNNIKITPLRFLFSHPGMEVSYERYYNEKFSTQVSYARLYDIEFVGNIIFPSSGSGNQFSIEEKYFFRQSIVRPYISVEAGYFDIENSHFSEYIDYQESADYYGHKTIGYLVPKFGAQFYGKRFVMEEYIGLGFKHQESRYICAQNPSNYYTEDFMQVKIVMNFKLGILF